MKNILIVLLLTTCYTVSAQDDDIRRNFIKIGINLDWGVSIYRSPGLTYERIIGQKNSFNVSVHYLSNKKIYDDATGKDLESKLGGVLLGVSYRRYFTKKKPAPNGVFIEPGVAAAYWNNKTKYIQYYSPVSSATYTSDYVTVNPFFNIGYQLLFVQKIVIGLKINMGYMIAVYENERRPAGTTYDPVQSKFFIGFGIQAGFGLK